MKQFIKSFLIFSSFALLIYVVLIILFGQFAPQFFLKNLNYKRGGLGNMLTRLKEADTTKNVDILFLGSSHAYRSYDPRMFKDKGYRIFALGSSAQTPLQTNLLVKKYLSSMNPKFVVLDVYPFIFENDGTESTLDLVSNTKIDKNTLQLAFDINSIKVYNTIIYGEYRQLFGLNKKIKEPTVSKNDTYIPGGFIQSYAAYKAPRRMADVTIKINEKQMKAFDEITAILQARKIPFILVQTPITKKRYNAFLNNNAMDSIFSKKGPYYNFNHQLKFADSLFIDDNHLNQKGVDIFDKVLIDVLSSKIDNPNITPNK